MILKHLFCDLRHFFFNPIKYKKTENRAIQTSIKHDFILIKNYYYYGLKNLCQYKKRQETTNQP